MRKGGGETMVGSALRFSEMVSFAAVDIATRVCWRGKQVVQEEVVVEGEE